MKDMLYRVQALLNILGLSKHGGVGISLSNVRANNDPIRGIYGLADGGFDGKTKKTICCWKYG